MTEDWSLVLSIILLLGGSGVMLLYHMVIYYPLFIQKATFPSNYRYVVMCACFAALAGSILSFLRPGLSAINLYELSNPGYSWHNIEVICLYIFDGFLITVTILHFTIKTYKPWFRLLLNLTSLSAVTYIYSLTKIFPVSVEPSWNQIFTLLGFLFSSLIIGATLLQIFAINYGSWASQKSLSGLSVWLLIIYLVMIPLQITFLSDKGPDATKWISLLLDDNMELFLASIILMVAALGTAIWAYLEIRSKAIKPIRILMPSIILAIMALIALITARILFFKLI